MIDPKQEVVVTDFTQERINALNNTIANLERNMIDARAEIIKWNRLADDASRDCSIVLAMVQHFVTLAVERGDHTMIRDAVEYAHDDTRLEYDVIAEALDRMGVCDPDEYCKHEFRVQVTVPVSVTVDVVAFNETDAEEIAQNMIDMDGLDDYHMEYDVYYNADFYVEHL